MWSCPDGTESRGTRETHLESEQEREKLQRLNCEHSDVWKSFE